MTEGERARGSGEGPRAGAGAAGDAQSGHGRATGDPIVERPTIPGYGVPESAEGLLPWSWAEQRLRDALTYWISTTRPDGRPHAAPVWAVWVDGLLWFEGGLGTRRARNLARDPRAVVSVHVDDATAIIVEGVVEVRTDPDEDVAARLVEGYGKYRAEPWRYEADPANWRSGSGGALWALRPRKVLGWSRFPADATRWRFEEAAQATATEGGGDAGGPGEAKG